MLEYTPWLTNKSLEWLTNYLKPDMTVFEYGSGGSTLFFSKHAKQVVSVEHDERWHKKVLPKINKNSAANVDYILHVPNKITKTNKYVNSVSTYPNNFFDLVLVDGLDRNDCCSAAISKIKKGGYLVLDDSDRIQYKESLDLLSKYPRTDFKGRKSSQIMPGMTTVWQISEC